jgi:hypothetical protein
VHLFLAGQSSQPLDVDRARRALAALLAELPFDLSPAELRTWSSPSRRTAIVSVAPSPDRIGGVSYVALEAERAALFAGRPVLWRGGNGADGTRAIDARTYLRPAAEWAHELDGRCTAARADGERLELFSDQLGAYPVFETTGADARWFSNSADLLRRIGGRDEVDVETLASVLAGGWSLGGQPLWRGVRRVARGQLLALEPGVADKRTALLPLERIAASTGGRLDPAAAATTLVQLVTALANWPGRPDVVPVTGGRDSRLVLAAALQAGIAFDARTGGAPSDPDVQVAVRLCATAGVPHELLPADPHGDRLGRVRDAARITMLTSGGTATLADAAGYPLGLREGPLPVWHSGQEGRSVARTTGSVRATSPIACTRGSPGGVRAARRSSPPRPPGCSARGSPRSPRSCARRARGSRTFPICSTCSSAWARGRQPAMESWS